MAYVPPHKRHSKNKDKEGPLPSPELLPPQTQFKKNTSSSLKSSKSHANRSGKAIYAEEAMNNWFVVGFHHDDDDHNNHLPPSLQFHPISLQLVDSKFAEKPLILVNTHQPQDTTERNARSPAEIIADNALHHLLSSFENVRNEMEVQNSQQVKPTLVARFGKLLFHGEPSVALEAVRKNLAAGTMSRQLKKSFYTNIPTSYIDRTTKGELLEVGLHFEEEKDLYHVKLSDANQPNATITCKCRIMKEQKKLHHYKIELNQVRHMVTDISCLTKNLDLRLMLCTKRILTALKDDELQCIQNLIEAAVLDPNVKGGLRWPLGKAYSGDRFSVVGVWHTITKAYRSPSLRLKVRDADRFDFQTSTGESASEIYLKLKGIVSVLQVQEVDVGLISKMLEDNLKLIWDHFLNCENFLG